MTVQSQSGELRQGRVVSNHGRDAVIEDGAHRRIRCRLRGRRLAVVCGDHVRWVAQHSEGAEGLITEVEPRTTELARLNGRGATEVVAANLTQLVAVVAALPIPDFALCDRYLAAARWSGLKACVVGNKCDLPDAQAQLGAALDLYAEIGYGVIRASKQAVDGVRELALRLAGETSVLVGQSGVGKSSLINRLVPGVETVVRGLSLATESGRHTTSAATLYHLPSGGDLIDSPGVRDFAPPLPEARSVADGFREIGAAAIHCRFKDCLHRREPGCAVATAVQAGTISARRIKSYRHLVELAEDFARRGPQFRQ